MKKRLLYFDMAKAFAIMCVILAHTGYEIPKIFKTFAFSFHMPLFFVVSGIFLKPNCLNKDSLKKTVDNLLRPYFLTGITIIVISVICDLYRKKNIIPNLIKWISAIFYGSGARTDWSYWPTEVYMFGAAWFLLALIWGKCFLYWINVICQEKEILKLVWSFSSLIQGVI